MADNGKTLGQQYYEAVEALKAKGTSNAEAIKKVAADFGKKENAVRGGIHQYKTTQLSGVSGTVRRVRRAAKLTVDDFVANARRELENALAMVDSEVEQAKQALDEAQARYDKVTAEVKERKADIGKKLKALA